MIRTRMLWFSFGFASSSASIAHFMYKDLWFDRSSIASEIKERFKSLDSRVSNLESVLSSKTNAPRQFIIFRHIYSNMDPVDFVRPKQG